ncbi:Type 1 glutamine amidotransferase-like domain-containing protein [Bacillus cereus]|nr:Type 1 glutamine amidotransferase-like domain-containing protein [Bacillus cereus]MDR4983910.1 Type 1 glutamine amidotransferase-like domain-containing protein [Bacillus cereus]
MRQIITLGGGGFSMEPDNPLLDLYILKQAKKAKPQICFIPTASGDSDKYILFLSNHFRLKYNHLRYSILYISFNSLS